MVTPMATLKPIDPTDLSLAAQRMFPRQLDLDHAPASVALPLLAAELKALAETRFPHLSDLICDVVIDPRSGVCSIHFRAIR